jgi:hypothetical protein
MFAVKAIYDGNTLNFAEPIPVTEKYETIVTFTHPVKKSRNDLLKYAGTWDDEDVEIALEMMKERESFTQERPEV